MKYLITIAVVLALLAFIHAQDADDKSPPSDTEIPLPDPEAPYPGPEASPRPHKPKGHKPPHRLARPGIHPLHHHHYRLPHPHEEQAADNEDPEIRSPRGHFPRRPAFQRIIF